MHFVISGTVVYSHSLIYFTIYWTYTVSKAYLNILITSHLGLERNLNYCMNFDSTDNKILKHNGTQTRANSCFLNEHFTCKQTAAGIWQNLKQAVCKFYWQLFLVIFVNRIFLLCITTFFYCGIPSKNNLLALITFIEIYDLMLIQW